MNKTTVTPSKKITRLRATNVADEKYTGSEPVWNNEVAMALSGAAYTTALRNSLFFYNYYFCQKELRRYVIDWVALQPSIPNTIAIAYAKTPANATNMTACGIARAFHVGMPLRQRETEYMHSVINNAIQFDAVAENSIDDDDNTMGLPKAPTKTIQHRLKDIAKTHIAYIQGMQDDMICGSDTAFNLYAYLQEQNVPQVMIKQISLVFESDYDEFKAGTGLTIIDEQLTEAYSHLNKSGVTRYTKFYTALAVDFARYTQVKKATRAARTKRVPNKDKLVSKLKYMRESKDLKLVSVNPTDIIGATQLWVYETKKRKIFVYNAGDHDTLGVKGTTITGFSNITSTGKTLRKPNEQLAEFLKANKVALRKYINSISTVDTNATGRINADTILLKVI